MKRTLQLIKAGGALLTLLLISLVLPSSAWAQTTIYQETFGNSSNNYYFTDSNASSYFTATSDMFTTGTVSSNYSGAGRIGKSTVNASTGYDGASGNSAAWRTGTKGDSEKEFIVISNINIADISDLNLSFGLYYKDGYPVTSSKVNKVNIKYQIDEGDLIDFSFDQPAKKETWTLCSGSLSGTGTSLKLYFYHTSTGGGYTVRIDDIKITGTKSSASTQTTTLTLDKTTWTPKKGDTYTLTPTLMCSSVILTADPAITYKSSDEDVVTVDADGKMTAVGYGEATITASYAGNSMYGDSKATCKVTVEDTRTATTLTLVPSSSSVTVGNTVSTTTTLTNSATTVISGATITYTSSDAKVATVSDAGVITGVATGEATITATFAGDDTYKSSTATCKVTVVSAGTTLEGDGTLENPYTVADVKALYSASSNKTGTIASNVWVKGTICGARNNSTIQTSSFTVNTNILLGTTSSYIPVQLVDDYGMRDYASLKTNADDIDQEILVCGDITAYFSMAGVKNVKKINGCRTLTISDKQYTTFYAAYRYVIPEGVTGYTISKAENGVLTLNDVYTTGKVTPVNTSLLFKSDDAAGGTFPLYFDCETTTTAAGTNLLHGANELDSDNKTSVEPSTTSNTMLYYVLTEGSKGFGFYWAEENGAAATYQAPHAFLAIETTGSDSGIKGFSLEDATTGIAIAPTVVPANAAIYTLSGVRVNATTTDNLPAGLYIVGGKKVIVK